MTRKVVAIEGKLARDGRLIILGAISMKKNVIPVMMDGYDVVGKATNFERNEETGEISLDITTQWKLVDSLNTHITLYNLVVDTLPDCTVIKSGVLVGIFLSEGDSAWPELNRKERPV